MAIYQTAVLVLFAALICWGDTSPLNPINNELESVSPNVPTAPNSLGPVFPITASWFRDRFTKHEWDQTLKDFQNQGGDTVFLRAPPIIRRTRDDLETDLNFLWCGSSTSSAGTGAPMCYDEAIQELTQMGLKVTALATYQYEEDFSDAIMLCPKLDRKIYSSRVYFRIVLHANQSQQYKSPCDFPTGSDVVVLFTSFAGTDPHHLLLQSASSLNMSVYFSLPAVPKGFDNDLMTAYYEWVDRVLLDHQRRYNKNNKVIPHWVDKSFQSVTDKLYSSLAGYYGTDEVCLAQVTPQYLQLYGTLGKKVKTTGKKFAISPYINLNRSLLNATVAQHVTGFKAIAATGVVNVIAVQEGRGAAKGCYYWPHEVNQSVSLVDPVLDQAIHYIDPALKVNITFAEAFSSNNRDIFAAFQRAQHELIQSRGLSVDLWLNVEAFEYLRNDPCLPVDPMSSGMGELLNRANKSRVEHGLSVASAMVQKVISFAWDSDYLCVSKNFTESLHDEIMNDKGNTLVANCSFHNPHNLSVVLLGFNLASYYTVEWTDTRNRTRTDNVYAYYFEMDYGLQHNLVESLEYTMLWDIPAMVTSLAPTGTVKVTAQHQTRSCYYEYDLPYRY